MTVYKLRIPGSGWSVCDTKRLARDAVRDALDDLKPGDTIQIEAAEMTREQLDALPWADDTKTIAKGVTQ
jgi:hypothetical protein